MYKIVLISTGVTYRMGGGFNLALTDLCESAEITEIYGHVFSFCVKATPNCFHGARVVKFNYKLLKKY